MCAFKLSMPIGGANKDSDKMLFCELMAIYDYSENLSDIIVEFDKDFVKDFISIVDFIRGNKGGLTMKDFEKIQKFLKKCETFVKGMCDMVSENDEKADAVHLLYEHIEFAKINFNDSFLGSERKGVFLPLKEGEFSRFNNSIGEFLEIAKNYVEYGVNDKKNISKILGSIKKLVVFVLGD